MEANFLAERDKGGNAHFAKGGPMGVRITPVDPSLMTFVK